jgi:DNA polymerase-3 subunit gamma/tau
LNPVFTAPIPIVVKSWKDVQANIGKFNNIFRQGFIVVDNNDADEDALYLIARKADGALRDALSAFDKIASLGEAKITRRLVADHLGILDFDVYFDMVDLMYGGDTRKLLQYFNNLVNGGVDIHFFIGGLTSHFRDILMAKHPQTIDILEQSDEIKQRYKEQAGYFDEDAVTSAIDILVRADLDYKLSQHPLLLTELSLLKILNVLQGVKKKMN